MRRWLTVAALGAALVAMPVWAQRRGGGFAAGGGHAGFASRGPAFGGRGPAFGGRGPAFGGRGPMMGNRGPTLGSRGPMGGSRGPGFSRGWHSPNFGTGFNRPFRSRYYAHRYRYSNYGYGYGYPYYGYPYYGYPGYYDDYDSGSSYDAAGADYGGDTGADREQQAQIDRLEDEVNRLRQERESRLPATRTESGADLHGVTELVFRDKHTQEVENYAIIGQNFWVLDAQRTTRIPLADLDLPATIKANDQHGVDFELPR